MGIGRRKLLDDVFEASQEGAPLFEEISQLDALPLAETPGDLKELFRQEPALFDALLRQALPGKDCPARMVDIQAANPSGNFPITIEVNEDGWRTLIVHVDASGRFIPKERS